MSTNTIRGVCKTKKNPNTKFAAISVCDKDALNAKKQAKTRRIPAAVCRLAHYKVRWSPEPPPPPATLGFRDTPIACSGRCKINVILPSRLKPIRVYNLLVPGNQNHRAYTTLWLTNLSSRNRPQVVLTQPTKFSSFTNFFYDHPAIVPSGVFMFGLTFAIMTAMFCQKPSRNKGGSWE